MAKKTKKSTDDLTNDDPKTFKETDLLPSEQYGMRHLIECNCISPVFKNRNPVIWHKFPVFSIIDEDNNVIPKYAQCNNCGIIHKITEIGVSEITTKEHLKSIRNINDIKFGIQSDIAGLLEQYNKDISVWEETEFILNNEKWGSMIILDQETEDGITSGKVLVFQGEPVLVKVESFSRKEIVE